MDILTDFFKSLNKSIEYIDSTNYKSNTLRFLKENNGVSGKCLVLGAGNLSDVPLDYLVSNFEEVILSDIDEAAINQNLDLSFKNIQIIKCEYTGLEGAGLFNGLLNEMNITTDKSRLVEFLNNIIDKDYNQKIKSQFDDKYDLIYISPIYTQLIYKQILMIFDLARDNGYPEHIIKFLETEIMNKMVSIIDRFNNLVKVLLTKTGEVIVFSDIFEGRENDDFMIEIIKNSTNQEKLTEIYEDYFNTYGFGLGDYGLYSLTQSFTVKDEEYFLWPLNKDKYYLVKGVYLSR